MRRWLVLVFFLFSWQLSDTEAQQFPLDILPDCGFTDLINDESLSIGAVVVDFQTGLGCVENLDRRYNAASVPKVYIAGAYFDAFLNGTLSPTAQEFTEDYWMGGRMDCLQEDDIGRTFAPRTLIDLMINCSDNAATWMLMDKVGASRVNAYAQRYSPNIGEIIHYADVDRIKLSLMDARWENVPSDYASRYYRGRITDGLANYINPVPDRPQRERFIEANQQYFDEYTTNTITPRALADYFMALRSDLSSGGIDALVAENVFDSMLYTQRLFSAQDIPGNVYVASKNGFDSGLLAEANLLFNSLDERVPTGLVLLFGQYETLTRENASLPTSDNSQLDDHFRTLSGEIRNMLYPNYREPAVMGSFKISSVILNTQDAIQPCWNPYFESGFDEQAVASLDRCLRNTGSRITFPLDQNAALGMTLRNLFDADTRFTLIFTAPSGRRYSYQTDRDGVNEGAIYWFHPIDSVGVWTVDVYINLEHAYQEQLVVQQ